MSVLLHVNNNDNRLLASGVHQGPLTTLPHEFFFIIAFAAHVCLEVPMSSNVISDQFNPDYNKRT